MASAAPEPVSISDSWVATDALGRKLPGFEQAGPPRPGKLVGMFYWTWHILWSQGSGPPRVAADVIAKCPEAADDFRHPAWEGQVYFWGEPLLGFYSGVDPWVFRKHAEMLADAGVDFVLFDCTNANLTFKPAYTVLMDVWAQARRDGVRTPQVGFMLPFWHTEGSLQSIEQLYTELYRPGLHEDLWFRWKGKPFIMAHPDNIQAVPGDEAKTRLHTEIREFFTFRPGQPVYQGGWNPNRDDLWSWLEIHPQSGYGRTAEGGCEQVSVGVAQNWSAARGLTAMNAPGSFGRSYTHAHGHDPRPDAYKYGLNFQEQWERAMELDPEVVFVTGWNEWIVTRQELWQQQPNAFPDEFDTERSRDIEPMKGGHGDNYYYQLVGNIRRFKGMAPPEPAGPPVSVSIDGQSADWAQVRPLYRHRPGTAAHRDCDGWKGCHYTNKTGRNNFLEARVARDASNLYFYMRTAAPISPPTDPKWMMLFIDIDRDKATGWEGYDFVINRLSPAEGQAVIEKSIEGWSWTRIGTVDYAVAGNEIEICIPKSLIGAGEFLDFEFKWADNMQSEGDITDLLLYGDAAPPGRFNYLYRT